MSSRDLLRDPCWQGSDLGHPLPDATHAVSVALPRWRDVIAYEENQPACRGALRAVYPRLVYPWCTADLSPGIRQLRSPSQQLALFQQGRMKQLSGTAGRKNPDGQLQILTMA